jgi:hypothetical protein
MIRGLRGRHGIEERRSRKFGRENSGARQLKEKYNTYVDGEKERVKMK